MSLISQIQNIFINKLNKYMKQDRIIELDGLRAIAIIFVIIVHFIFNQLQVPDNPFLLALYKLIGYTWSGVDLFFILSGYLIGGILIDNKNSPNYFKTFYTRRFFRIFPLYYLFLAMMILLSFLLNSNINSLYYREISIFSYLTYTQNIVSFFTHSPIGITWSLAIEEQFYLFLPFIIYFFDRKKLPYVFLIFITISIILRSFFYYPYSLDQLFYRMDSLLMGSICAFYLKEDRWFELINKHYKFFIIAFWGILATIIGLILTDIVLIHCIQNNLLFLLLNLLYSTLLIIVILNKSNVLSKILRNRLMVSIGQVSYGIYLYHLIVLGSLFKIVLKQNPSLNNLKDLTIIIFSIIITYFLSIISYKIYEKPILKIGSRFKY